MLYDYRQESKTPMLLTLANGKTIEGEFIDLRIDTNTLPKVNYGITFGIRTMIGRNLPH
mgnify:CR=1 FL=1